ncbi:MAG: ORC1-type DNA replication protein [Candidatus Odinarchaeum yellowstonii]|uniref:ORC1-type DNA replication protein n=1 Tax=Odinarchaeota yellowstonii (strain LCB_4) TaxID=1841599 RepID=A0AAF0D3M5_ODILC|nr:MAG: ORC1-type DNA replication protein [Candidatus Odinarchaeum yellowstonii]
MDTLEEKFQKISVFKDESKLSVFYVPENLPHRERELHQLLNIFKPVIDSPGAFSRIVLITGPVGTGKTAVAKRLGALIGEAAKRGGVNLKYVHINCRREKTNFLILLQLARSLIPNIPNRGYSPAELLNIIVKSISEQDVSIILVLDEIDYILNTIGEEIIYDLTRVNDEKLNFKQPLSIILISKNDNIQVMLDESVLSLIPHSIIKFQPYTALQLEHILEERVKEAFYPSTISPGVLSLIAEIASEWGDARYALELLWRAGKYAEEEGLLKIFPEHVRKARADTCPEISKELILNLDRNDKLILLSISRTLIRSRVAYAPIGLIEKIYRLICEEYREKPRSHTQIWDRVRVLSRIGLISTRLSGKGVRGKSTIIGLADIPAEVLEKELIEWLKK